LQVADAEAQLRGQYQLDVALVPEPKSTRPEGEVLAQSVVSGATVQVGSKVTLTYSAPEAVVISDVAGATAATASANLTASGFEVVSVDEASDTVELGKAIRTDPVAGTKAKAKSKVTLYVSSGLPKVLVPDVIGLGTDGANRAITDAGLKFEVKFQDVAAGSTQANKVISQSVIANTQVTKGSTVIVIIGRVPVVTTTTAVATTTTTPGATTTTSRP
jgi:serine/threonine-protein kinase